MLNRSGRVSAQEVVLHIMANGLSLLVNAEAGLKWPDELGKVINWLTTNQTIHQIIYFRYSTC